ncbi:D-erythronate dehydrogenase [Bordetella sp. 02P26C-1]|uniref:D-erythronate dehydrogenase n=1 Tax=Bordetella sp. 02P26C-1 TaxID=2683195 RepID=UPI0013559C46|nr:D-erythronate dehydrogenase [Bordetella sp. 02P26C-1]MVW77314.1 NAD-dependent epimerase/dehydratase family protein [Bordetella sp. 02P26C-1]
MQIAITGGGGFLASMLVRRLLESGVAGKPVTRIVTIDLVPCPVQDPRVESIVSDVADPNTLARAITTDTHAIVHLAAVVSGQAEADFDLGMRVNIDATRALLEHARALGTKPRFVFTSSVAAFGGTLPERVQDDTRTLPQSSYGVQKVIGELLVGDYTRKGYIDGITLRVPTISVRPGAPNKAASSFASGIIREPLAGVEAVCPVSPELRMWLQSPDRAIDNLAHALEVDGALLGNDRTVNLPGLSVSVGSMIEALRTAAGDAVTKLIRYEPDPAVERIVASWPNDFETVRARALGFVADEDYVSVVRAHMARMGMTSTAAQNPPT